MSETARSDMGEVRVRVRLTNAVDEALARRGTLTPAEVRTYEADALVDTGAVRMVLPPQVAARLGLGIRGQRVAGEYADGRTAEVDISGGSFPTLRTRTSRSRR